LLDSRKLDCWIHANWIAGFTQTGLLDSRKLDCWIHANWIAEFPQTRLLVSSNLEYRVRLTKGMLGTPAQLAVNREIHS
jgi:hypothetical protein